MNFLLKNRAAISWVQGLHLYSKSLSTLPDSTKRITVVKVKEVAQSCLTLCNPVDCSPLNSSIHGILQARILEWVAISFSRGSSRPWDQTQVSRIVGGRFTIWATITNNPIIFPVSQYLPISISLLEKEDIFLSVIFALDNLLGWGLLCK